MELLQFICNLSLIHICILPRSELKRISDEMLDRYYDPS